MNLLLDTHVLLWWLNDSPELSETARTAISEPNNLIVLSSVIIWEIRMKQVLGKLEIDPDFYAVIKNQRFDMLPITSDHAFAVGNLPMHHRDPFDRMIIAQATLEGLNVVTHDSIFKKYGVPVLEV